MEMLKDLDLVKVKAELCRRSFYFFVKEFWGEVIAEEPIWNWHIEELCKILRKVGYKIVHREKKEEDLIINVPPGSSKSTICSIMFPAWLWCIDPTIKLISGSYSSALSLELSTKSRNVIQSEKFKAYFPHVRIKEDQNAKGNFQTKQGGERHTTSTGGSVTGMHGHCIIVDDPQNPELANSPLERDNTNEWVSGTLSTRKISQAISVMIVIQQRLHPQDVTGYLLSKGKRFNHICLPAILNKSLRPERFKSHYKDNLLDPIRLNTSVLDEMKIDMGTKAFNTQILQSPQDEEDSIIKESWLPIISPVEYQLLVKDKPPIVDFYLDTAYTDNTKNDPSVILSCSKIGEILYITNVSQVWLEFPKLIPHIKSFLKENGYTNQSRIKIEPKASGKSIVQYMRTQTHLNVSESKPPTTSKIERLNGISPKVEAGKVCLVSGNWNKMFISEVTCNDPIHDDIRDTFIMSIEDKLIKGRNHGKYNHSII